MMRNDTLEISVVIPVYNSASLLLELVERLDPVLSGLTESFEVILINDGSWDKSSEVIDQLSKKHDWIVPVNLIRNYGQHNALLCGIRLARFGLIVTMDDDLQHPPEEIPKLIDELNRGYDVVYGTPLRPKHTFARNCASWLTKLFLKTVIGAENAQFCSAFRIIKTPVRNAFADFKSSNVFIDVLLTWGTTRFSHISVRHEPRKAGNSNYSFWKLLTHSMNMMCGFSVLPLRAATSVGFLFTLFGFMIMVYVLYGKLCYGISVPGFAFLAIIVSVFSGVILFTIGIMGEYLARIHLRVMDRPAYVMVELEETEK